MKRIAWIIIYLLILAVASLIFSKENEIPWSAASEWVADLPSYLNNLVLPWREEAVTVTTIPRFGFPVNGPIIASYGWQQHPLTRLPYYHRAIDIGVAVGTPVRSVGEGRVSRVAYGTTLGHTVIIQHEQEWASGYAHLDQVLVGEGDFVATGTVIAQSGISGLLRLGTEPHLHFMLFFRDMPVEPGLYLAAEQPGRNLQ